MRRVGNNRSFCPELAHKPSTWSLDSCPGSSTATARTSRACVSRPQVRAAGRYSVHMSASTKPPRRWLQFRLRSLLVVVTLIAVVLGWRLHVWRAAQEQQQNAIDELKARGADAGPAFGWAEAMFSPGRIADNSVIFNDPRLTDDDFKSLE